MNVLFDFYGNLLTEKQQTFLKWHFHDDYSLGEIAADHNISRQAVYEHLKRAEIALEEYEDKLGLAARQKRMQGGLDALEELANELPEAAGQRLRDAAFTLRTAAEPAGREWE